MCIRDSLQPVQPCQLRQLPDEHGQCEFRQAKPEYGARVPATHAAAGREIYLLVVRIVRVVHSFARAAGRGARAFSFRIHFMKRVALFLSVALLLAGSFAPRAQQSQATASPWSADISEIRRTAALLPGRKASRINVLKFAESHRTKNFSVKGEPATPSVQARTVFQAVSYTHLTLPTSDL